MKIQDKALLANLTISTWTARKFDKKATATVTSTHHTDTNAGRYNKSLVAKSRLDEITKIAGKARTYHYEHTLPYQQKGQAILATAIMVDYMAKIKELKTEFNSAVENFLIDYPIIQQEARSSLGDLYNDQDYPTSYKLREKFDMEIDFSPIPEGSHLTINIDAADLENIQRDIEERVQDSVQAAMKELWQRLYDVTAAIKERLTPEANGEAKLFRDSLIKNALDLAELLPKLNITDDPDLNQIADEIRRELSTIDPQHLRKYPDVRKDTATTATAIMDKINRQLNRAPEPETAPVTIPEQTAPTTPELFTPYPTTDLITAEIQAAAMPELVETTPDTWHKIELTPNPAEIPAAYQLPIDLDAKLRAAGII